jgi:2,3-bisphosphoglycerate-independent phosphoglycerate mutase
MDRDKNWHRTKRAEEAIFEGKGDKRKSRKPSEVLRELYQEQVIDELLEPLVFLDDNGRGWPIQKNDGIFFFNYRPDRARQLSLKITERKHAYNLCFVTMTPYEKTLEAITAFPAEQIPHSLAETISRSGLRQVHIAETEKYPHVTYFFNGGLENPHTKEKFILIDSRRDIATHDEAPEMKAHEIATKAIEEIKEGADVLILNFANADMVGHTANVPAIIAAVTFVDRQLKRVIGAIEKAKGIALISSDHGNAEMNIDDMTNVRHTAHTLNPVPFIVTEKKFKIRPSGTLADIAPTILEILKIPQPSCMTGVSLLKNQKE